MSRGLNTLFYPSYTSRGWYFPYVERDRRVELAYLGIVLLLGSISLDRCRPYVYKLNKLSNKKKITPTTARSKSNIMPATQPTDTRQRKNTDKAAEALHYLVKLSLLGQKMVGIGASLAPQSKSAPESKLSYPENTINLYVSGGPWAPQS